MWARLLVPHDFSVCADRALGLAARLAPIHGARVTLLHVCKLPPNVAADALIVPPGGGPQVRADDFVTHGTRQRLEALAAPARAAGVEVDILATASGSGDLTGEILHAASRVDADVLIVGTHGRTGLAHLLIGSVAEAILRRAEIPVITVRAGGPDSRPTLEESALEDESDG